jgi:hypothetical protein
MDMAEVPCQNSVLVIQKKILCLPYPYIARTIVQWQAIRIMISDLIHKDLGSGIPKNNAKDL